MSNGVVRHYDEVIAVTRDVVVFVTSDYWSRSTTKRVSKEEQLALREGCEVVRLSFLALADKSYERERLLRELPVAELKRRAELEKCAAVAQRKGAYRGK